jgi:hypothetical protein
MVVKNGQMLMRPTSRSRRMSGELLVPTTKIAAMMTGAMSGAMMIGATIATTAVMTSATDIMIGKTTPGGDRATTAQWTTPSMPSS